MKHNENNKIYSLIFIYFRVLRLTRFMYASLLLSSFTHLSILSLLFFYIQFIHIYGAPQKKTQHFGSHELTSPTHKNCGSRCRPVNTKMKQNEMKRVPTKMHINTNERKKKRKQTEWEKKWWEKLKILISIFSVYLYYKKS